MNYMSVADALLAGLAPLGCRAESWGSQGGLLEAPNSPGAKVAVAIGNEAFARAYDNLNNVGPNIAPSFPYGFIAPESQLRIDRCRRIIAVVFHDQAKVRSVDPRFVAVYSSEVGHWRLHLASVDYTLLKYARWFLILSSIPRLSISHVHGAVVYDSERPYLLIGNKGCGKTTMTLGLVEAGLGVLTDDAAFVSSSGTPVPLFPSGCPVIRVDAATAGVFRRTASLILPNESKCVRLTDDPASKLEVPVHLFQPTASHRCPSARIHQVVLLSTKSETQDEIHWMEDNSLELWKDSLRLPGLVSSEPERMIDQPDPHNYLVADWKQRRQALARAFSGVAPIDLPWFEAIPSRLQALLTVLGSRGARFDPLGVADIATTGLSPCARNMQVGTRMRKLWSSEEQRMYIRERLSSYIRLHPEVVPKLIANLDHLGSLANDPRSDQAGRSRLDRHLDYLSWKYWFDNMILQSYASAAEAWEAQEPGLHTVLAGVPADWGILILPHYGLHLPTLASLSRLRPLTLLQAKRTRDEATSLLLQKMSKEGDLQFVDRPTEAIQAGRMGRTVAVMADTMNLIFPAWNVSVPFFGEQLSLAPGFVQLQPLCRRGVLFLGNVLRQSNGGSLQWTWRHLVEADDASMKEVMGCFMEELVIQDPTQWDRAKYVDRMLCSRTLGNCEDRR